MASRSSTALRSVRLRITAISRPTRIHAAYQGHSEPPMGLASGGTQACQNNSEPRIAQKFSSKLQQNETEEKSSSTAEHLTFILRVVGSREEPHHEEEQSCAKPLTHIKRLTPLACFVIRSEE